MCSQPLSQCRLVLPKCSAGRIRSCPWRAHLIGRLLRYCGRALNTLYPARLLLHFIKCLLISCRCWRALNAVKRQTSGRWFAFASIHKPCFCALHCLSNCLVWQPACLQQASDRMTRPHLTLQGVVLWEIITGERPHLRQLRPIRSDQDLSQTMVHSAHKVVRNAAPDISSILVCRVPQECPQEVKDIVTHCRASEPASRPSARQVFARLSHSVQLASSCPKRHAPGEDDRAGHGRDGSLPWSMPMGQPFTGRASPP